MQAGRIVKWYLTLAGLFAGPVLALPADQVIQYDIHVDPSDPSSRVQYTLAVSITAVSQDGNWIAWDVTNYQITEWATLGADTVWDVDNPHVDTADGYWWVSHSNPNDPQLSDFVKPARVSDTAIANDPTDPDLDFDVTGKAYVPPSGGAPYQVTGSLDFRFSTTPDPNDPPDDGGDDEPVDLPLPPDGTPTAQ